MMHPNCPQKYRPMGIGMGMDMSMITHKPMFMITHIPMHQKFKALV